MDKFDIMSIIEPILNVVITTAIPVIILYIRQFLNTKKRQIINQIENDKLRSYVDVALDAVSKAVLNVFQTYVDSLKNSGKFNKQAQNEAKSKAIALATSMITEDVRNAVNVLYGDFDKWLDATIESLVREDKSFNTMR